MKINWYANGTTFYDGEWSRTGGYTAEVRRDRSKTSPNHNYILSLDEHYNKKCKREGWRLLITLGSYYVIGRVLDKKFKYIKDAKKYAADFLKEYDVSDKPWKLIEEWKMKRCKPVFNMNLEYIGDEYLGVSACHDEEIRYVNEYFNDRPVDYTGYTYTLCLYNDLLNVSKNQCVPVCYGSCTMDEETDQMLRPILLEKTVELDNPYLERYRRLK